MDSKQLKSALLALNIFCGTNEISYLVTGTTALWLHGLPVKNVPNDIAIKVYNLSEKQIAKLKELEMLSGYTTKNQYAAGTMCFNINIQGVIVSAIIVPFENALNEAICHMNINDHLIAVQTVTAALKDKIVRGRLKDLMYINDLACNILAIKNYED